jgi:hypothetical protein
MSYTPNTTVAGTTLVASNLTYSIDNIYVGAVIKDFGKV